MAIYRNIQMSFWTDSKVADELTPEEKFFYLYLLTNPHTNLAGCYELSLRHAAFETGYTKETIERLVDRFEKVHKLVCYSKDTKEILLLNWHKYNWTKSEKFRKPLKSEIRSIKCDAFREYLYGLAEGEDTVSIPYPYGTDTTVTVTDTVTDTVKKKKASAFVPPTVTEVDQYIREKGYSVDPQRFVDFYECKGWMVGKNKMKDWKAAVRNWERTNKESPPKPTKFSNYTSDRKTDYYRNEMELFG